MRKSFRIQENSLEIQLGFCPISEMTFNPKSRDSVTRLLAGLQCVYQDIVFREEIINEIRLMVNKGKISSEKGREGLDFWSIFVFGMLRLVCNWSYDMLENIANNHRDIRNLIGLNDWLDADKKFTRTGLHANLICLDPEGLKRISQNIVQFAHRELGLSAIALTGRCGVSQELGVRFCIVEDQHGFLLNHRMMYEEQDKEMVVDFMKETKAIYKTFLACSFDKGFHSAKDNAELTNRDYIEQLGITAYLPVKGRPNKNDQERQSLAFNTVLHPCNLTGTTLTQSVQCT